MIEIRRDRIQIDQVIKSVQDPSAGGIDVFIGTTRNKSGGKEVVSLEYQAYEEMALKMMSELEGETRERWEIQKLSIVHRVGPVAIGEASVVIAVSSVHRREAFEACRFAIDRLKKQVPIWKKEVFADGETWIGEQEQ